MAKHPHKLIFVNSKTWKCVLNGCNFFVHLGLAHVLVGKDSICWDCEEKFIIDEISLKEDKPRCIDCRLARVVESIPEPKSNEENPIELEMNEARRKLYKEMGWIK